jgi:orotidine-5'-phosphate decarboxylase
MTELDVPGGASGGQIRESTETFGDRLADHVARRESQIVLGLDPNPARLWRRAIELASGAGTPPAPVAVRAARSVVIHCSLAIAAAGEHCVAVKLQVACFERLGAPGWAALAEVVEEATAAGLLVITDAKRGDIDFSATAYAQAFFGETPTEYGPVEGLGADALTVNPLQGRETIQAFLEIARPAGRGLFALVRTSNPGSADVQDLELAGGGTVSDRLASLVGELGCVGAAGIADVGAVVGATVPEHLERLRWAMPSAPFLLPGVGPQGGRVEDLAAAFAPGPAGGLVAASRGIVDAFERDGGDPEDSARREAARLREIAWSLPS